MTGPSVHSELWTPTIALPATTVFPCLRNSGDVNETGVQWGQRGVQVAHNHTLETPQGLPSPPSLCLQPTPIFLF